MHVFIIATVLVNVAKLFSARSVRSIFIINYLLIFYLSLATRCFGRKRTNYNRLPSKNTHSTKCWLLVLKKRWKAQDLHFLGTERDMKWNSSVVLQLPTCHHFICHSSFHHFWRFLELPLLQEQKYRVVTTYISNNNIKKETRFIKVSLHFLV